MNKACQTYVQEVLKFRRALNLTAISSQAMFEVQFIQPSLSIAQWVANHGRLLDIGSGMGIPGIPLLIAKPGLHGVLVERRRKRAEFLRHIVRTLRLDAEVFDADINDLPGLHVDICVARAVADQSSLLQMCTPHANRGAVAVLPVPRKSDIAHVAGWKMRGEYSVCLKPQTDMNNNDGDEQHIRCYDFSGA